MVATRPFTVSFSFGAPCCRPLLIPRKKYSYVLPMGKIILIYWITLGLSTICAAQPLLPNDFSMTTSLSRNDGIMVTVSPAYPYEHAELYVTMTPSLCLAKGTFVPFADKSGYESLKKVNDNPFFLETFEAYFDDKSPSDVNLCYLLVGRGQVEASAWGHRVPVPEPTSIGNPFAPGFLASRDRIDGILLELSPKITEITDLYVTPDDFNCPAEGQPFSFEGRFLKVINDSFFNGKSYFDSRAAIAVDLCYFLLSRRTQKSVTKTWGYRLP